MSQNASVIMTNQAAYINESQYIGRVKGMSVEIKRKTKLLGGLGGVGGVEVPTGKFDPITASIPFGSLSAKDIRTLNENGGYVKLRFTGVVRMLDTHTGIRKNGSLTTRVHGYVLNPPSPTYDDEQQDYTASVSVQFIEISDSSGQIFMIDFAKGLSFPQVGA
ncbi:phage major tail tube protein [Vibrio sp. OPT18]|uniref:phage major tail tube protein n=1 Tax=Vibrio sp. OPT18 TaxID=2778641 RepID=UPI0018823816|nr:phage major tail tube protein [Vibrio sp. OPT18]MBE8578715.1 phage major tail tube protein [Vibrio sp. OPT18]